MDVRGNFLALCLLEALEDEDSRSFEKLLLEYKANPNQIALERRITAFHYACGMDNLELAEYSTKVILDNGGDPNVRSKENFTPLHIAAVFGRTKLVTMLLQKGGNIHLLDNEKYTPLQYAVYECHFDVIEAIKEFVFQQKIEEKKKKLENNNNLISSKTNTNLNLIQNIEEKKYTPNRINYNFDVTSPYYINITHRRKPPLSSLLPPDTPPIENNDQNNIEVRPTTSDDSKQEQTFFTSTAINNSNDNRKNLFELTEENLSELSKNISPERSRISLIKSWREKVQRSKHRKSILGRFNDIDSLLSGIMTNDTLDFTNTILQSEEELNEEKSPTKTQFSSTAFGKLVEKLRKSNNTGHSDGSFITAEELANQSKLNESNFIKSPKATEYIYQMAEQYEHVDHDQGLVFFEQKLIMNIPESNLKAYQKQKQKELNQSQSSLSTDFTVPLDYDTEALRAELTQFGEPPGPITKSTKRLYTKRLIKFKRNPEKMECLKTTNNNQNQMYSVELQRTVKNVENFQRISTEYLNLENEMSEKFKNNHKLPDKKWREGNLKQSFIYLLIDPRMSNNLPCKSVLMNKHDIWTTFLRSIFYVGKGKSARPFSHLYEAMKMHSRTYKQPLSLHNNCVELNPKTSSKLYESPRKQESSKLERILDIWRNEYGVICLHVFHNILPAEAYTREAAIIDALGLQHLTNLKRGDYYGPAQTWTMRTRKFLGIALLFKALQIYLAEGESQLFPSDLV